MIKMSGAEAYAQLHRNVRARTFNMPSKQDVGHFVDGGIFPRITPRFKFQPNSKVFTIGSCFAREVESVLLDCDFAVPVAGFQIEEGELAFPGPHLLNEYNAGTIVQRLQAAAGTFDHGERGIELTDKGAIDLFLHLGSSPVTLERLRRRRREIGELYKELVRSDVVVITLGLVESWYDRVDNCHLNRAPSQRYVRAEPDRFEFQRMDLEDVYDRITTAIDTLTAIGLKQVILTVSPVPLEATFMPDSCPIANGYSKSVLRVCAELVSKRYEHVTYFPSFEIANSFGTAGFLDDNIHVQPWVVHHIMHYLIHNFVQRPVVEDREPRNSNAPPSSGEMTASEPDEGSISPAAAIASVGSSA